MLYSMILNHFLKYFVAMAALLECHTSALGLNKIYSSLQYNYNPIQQRSKPYCSNQINVFPIKMLASGCG